MTERPQATPPRRQQRKLLYALAAALFIAGVIVLAALERVPLPLRVAIGLGDIIAGATLFVLLRQKLSD